MVIDSKNPKNWDDRTYATSCAVASKSKTPKEVICFHSAYPTHQERRVALSFLPISSDWQKNKRNSLKTKISSIVLRQLVSGRLEANFIQNQSLRCDLTGLFEVSILDWRSFDTTNYTFFYKHTLFFSSAWGCLLWSRFWASSVLRHVLNKSKNICIWNNNKVV